jgi:hypothetical protein
MMLAVDTLDVATITYIVGGISAFVLSVGVPVGGFMWWCVSRIVGFFKPPILNFFAKHEEWLAKTETSVNKIATSQSEQMEMLQNSAIHRKELHRELLEQLAEIRKSSIHNCPHAPEQQPPRLEDKR